MNERQYALIMNVCIVVAVLAALFFDYMGSYSWIAGSVGLLSGLVVVVTHFYSEWSKDHHNANDTRTQLEDESANPDRVSSSGVVSDNFLVVIDESRRVLGTVESRYGGKKFLEHGSSRFFGSSAAYRFVGHENIGRLIDKLVDESVPKYLEFNLEPDVHSFKDVHTFKSRERKRHWADEATEDTDHLAYPRGSNATQSKPH